MSEPWRTRSSRVLFEHERIRIVEDLVTLPSGQDASWLRFEKLRDFVSVICLRRFEGGSEVLITLQYNHPLKRAVAEFPGGIVDDGETPLQAAHRELEEETGLRAHLMTPLGSYLVNPRRTPIQGFVFVANDFSEGAVRLEPKEAIELEWLSLGLSKSGCAKPRRSTATCSLLGLCSVFRREMRPASAFCKM